MILLAAIIFIAIFCSILLGAVGYVIADRMDRVERLQAHSVSIWRLARISALLPFGAGRAGLMGLQSLVLMVLVY